MIRCASSVFGVRTWRSKLNAIPSPRPAAATWASSSCERSQLPNFLIRYDFRLMPSRGMSGLSWNGCQRTEAARFPKAFSRRRLPMKHQGQITSEITSIVSIGSPGSLGSNLLVGSSNYTGGQADPWSPGAIAPGPELAPRHGMDKPSYLDFDKAKYAWRPDVDYREHPELYRVGKGERGVLICEPYKGELVPLWRFKTPDSARESSRAIYKVFLAYVRRDDFVGADMARK